MWLMFSTAKMRDAGPVTCEPTPDDAEELRNIDERESRAPGPSLVVDSASQDRPILDRRREARCTRGSSWPDLAHATCGRPNSQKRGCSVTRRLVFGRTRENCDRRRG